MAVISNEQIAAAALSAGFPPDKAVIAVAVALAESGGDPLAKGDNNNPKPGCGSYGLMQINSCPGRDRPGPPRYVGETSKLFDPVTNMKAALEISAGGNQWRPWTTWRHRTHEKYLPAATAAVAAVEGTPMAEPGGTLDVDTLDVDVFGVPVARDGKPVVGPVPLDPLAGVLDALGAVGGFLGMLTEWDTWRRVLYVVLGLLALALAASIIRADLTVRAVNNLTGAPQQ